MSEKLKNQWLSLVRARADYLKAGRELAQVKQLVQTKGADPTMIANAEKLQAFDRKRFEDQQSQMYKVADRLQQIGYPETAKAIRRQLDQPGGISEKNYDDIEIALQRDGLARKAATSRERLRQFERFADRQVRRAETTLRKYEGLKERADARREARVESESTSRSRSTTPVRSRSASVTSETVSSRDANTSPLSPATRPSAVDQLLEIDRQAQAIERRQAEREAERQARMTSREASRVARQDERQEKQAARGKAVDAARDTRQEQRDEHKAARQEMMAARREAQDAKKKLAQAERALRAEAHTRERAEKRADKLRERTREAETQAKKAEASARSILAEAREALAQRQPVEEKRDAKEQSQPARSNPDHKDEGRPRSASSSSDEARTQRYRGDAPPGAKPLSPADQQAAPYVVTNVSVLNSRFNDFTHTLRPEEAIHCQRYEEVKPNGQHVHTFIFPTQQAAEDFTRSMLKDGCIQRAPVSPQSRGEVRSTDSGRALANQSGPRCGDRISSHDAGARPVSPGAQR